MRYLACLALTACAAQPQYTWVGNGSDETLERDSAACEQQTLSAPIGRYDTERGLRIFFSCMRARGWSIAEHPSAHQ